MDPIVARFLAAEELGEVTLIRFGRLPPNAPEDCEPEWSFLPHVRMDGQAAFVHEVATHEGVTLPPPAPPRGMPLSTAQRFRAVLATLARARQARSGPHVRWKRFDRSAVPSIPSAVGYSLLSIDETRRVLGATGQRQQQQHALRAALLGARSAR